MSIIHSSLAKRAARAPESVPFSDLYLKKVQDIASFACKNSNDGIKPKRASLAFHDAQESVKTGKQLTFQDIQKIVEEGTVLSHDDIQEIVRAEKELEGEKPTLNAFSITLIEIYKRISDVLTITKDAFQLEIDIDQWFFNLSFSNFQIRLTFLESWLKTEGPFLQERAQLLDALALGSINKAIGHFNQWVQAIGMDLSDREFSARILKIFEHMYNAQDQNQNPLDPKSRKWMLTQLFRYWANACQGPFIREMACHFIHAFKTKASSSDSTIQCVLLRLHRELNRRTRDLFEINQIFSPVGQCADQRVIRLSLLVQLHAIPKFRKSLIHYQNNRISALNQFVKKLPQYTQEVEADRECAFKRLYSKETLKKIEARLLDCKRSVLHAFKAMPTQEIFQKSFKQSLFSKELFLEQVKTRQAILIQSVFHRKSHREIRQLKRPFIRAQKTLLHQLRETIERETDQKESTHFKAISTLFLQKTETLQIALIKKLLNLVIHLFKTIFEILKKRLEPVKKVITSLTIDQRTDVKKIKTLFETKANQRLLSALIQAQQAICKGFESQLALRCESLLPKKEEMPLPAHLYNAFHKHRLLLEELELIRRFIAESQGHQAEALHPMFVPEEQALRVFFKQWVFRESLE